MTTPRGLSLDLFNESAKTTDLSSSTGVAGRLTQWAPELWPVAPGWRPLIRRFLATNTAHRLGQFVQSRLESGAQVFPAEPFHALALTPLADVKVVVLGQDPYHGPGQAHGLAFSVSPGTPIPPSLRNIYKEIARETAPGSQGLGRARAGSLIGWAQQGVLLLNTCLTVEQGEPASHAKQGWEALTDEIIQTVGGSVAPVVFMLWGAHAQAKLGLIEAGSARVRGGVRCPDHLVLTASHPSPLSVWRGPTPFHGCAHFEQANSFLRQHARGSIDW